MFYFLFYFVEVSLCLTPHLPLLGSQRGSHYTSEGGARAGPCGGDGRERQRPDLRQHALLWGDLRRGQARRGCLQGESGAGADDCRMCEVSLKEPGKP